MTDMTWRVTPTNPPSMAVLIDGYQRVELTEADPVTNRTDLIATRLEPHINGLRRQMAVFEGTDPPSAPVTPPEWTALAEVTVLRGQTAVYHCHIGPPKPAGDPDRLLDLAERDPNAYYAAIDKRAETTHMPWWGVAVLAATGIWIVIGLVWATVTAVTR